MPELTTSEITQAEDERACYLLTNASDTSVATTASIKFRHYIQHYSYRLPLGKLQLLSITFYLPKESTTAVTETARRSAVKVAMAWQKRHLEDKLIEDKAASYFVLVLDVRRHETISTVESGDNSLSTNTSENNEKTIHRPTHSFGARYFMEELIIDVTETELGFNLSLL